MITSELPVEKADSTFNYLFYFEIVYYFQLNFWHRIFDQRPVK